MSGRISSVAYFADNNVSIYRDKHESIGEKFIPGLYSSVIVDNELILSRESFKELHSPFEDQGLPEVLKYVEAFVDPVNKEKINSLGYLYKCNVLLHGSAGVGKSSCSSFLMNELIKNKEAIVFTVGSIRDLEVTWSLCEEIRQIQDNLIIIYLDEFDNFLAEGKNEGYLKNLLDGPKSIEYSMVIGCTNHLDRIPQTISERPSRFRIVHEIKGITKENIKRSIIENVLDGKKDLLSEEDISSISTNKAIDTVDKIKNAIEDKIMDVSIGYTGRVKIGFGNDDTPLSDAPFVENSDFSTFIKDLSFINSLDDA